MSYETECSDDQLASLNDTRRAAGMKPITETAEQTAARRERHRAKIDLEIKAGVRQLVRQREREALAASRSPADALKRRQEAGKELRDMTARAAGMKPAQPIAAALSTPQELHVTDVQARAQQAERNAKETAASWDSVEPRSREGKLIDDLIRAKGGAFSPAQQASLGHLMAILREATAQALAENPGISRESTARALSQYFSVWATQNNVAGKLDAAAEGRDIANEVWSSRDRRQQAAKALGVEPSKPTAPGIPCSLGVVVCRNCGGRVGGPGGAICGHCGRTLHPRLS